MVKELVMINANGGLVYALVQKEALPGIGKENKMQSNFKCKEKCSAPCCGAIVLDIELENKHMDKIKNSPRYPCERKQEGDCVAYITSDLKCIFLDKENKCSVYEDRPDVCRAYGKRPDLQCPYVHMDGRLRTMRESRMIKSIIEAQLDLTMEHLKKRWGEDNVR
jgi:Fe-S-cluster containining protein